MAPRTFQDEFLAARGDLLYRTTPARVLYARTLPDVLRHAAGSFAGGANYDFYADHVNDLLVTRSVAREKTLAKAEARVARRVDRLETQEVERALATAYGRGLLASRFGPRAWFECEPERLGDAQRARLVYLGQRDRQDILGEQLRTFKAFRCTCKAYLGVVASDVGLRARGARIHFVLDGIDMDAVLDKTIDARAGYVPITTSELRYVYRNRDALADVVLFYAGGARVDPPWTGEWTRSSYLGDVTSRAARWREYGAARLRKYGGRLPTKGLLGPRDIGGRDDEDRACFRGSRPPVA